MGGLTASRGLLLLLGEYLQNILPLWVTAMALAIEFQHIASRVWQARGVFFRRKPSGIFTALMRDGLARLGGPRVSSTGLVGDRAHDDLDGPSGSRL